MSYKDQTINVNSFYFAQGRGQFKTFPRQIEVEDRKITFSDGLQYLVQKGQHVVRLFDMEDGEHIYRLRLENNLWTLIGTR